MFYCSGEAEESIAMLDKTASYSEEEDAAAEISIDQETDSLQI